jgi:hypothetical protein
VSDGRRLTAGADLRDLEVQISRQVQHSKETLIHVFSKFEEWIVYMILPPTFCYSQPSTRYESDEIKR